MEVGIPGFRFSRADCDLMYLQSGDASKMTFEEWRTKEIYRLGCCKKTISRAVSSEMFCTKWYIEERKEKLTKEQKQVLQNAIDDLRLYLGEDIPSWDPEWED